jgi:hypothetical protein
LYIGDKPQPSAVIDADDLLALQVRKFGTHSLPSQNTLVKGMRPASQIYQLDLSGLIW